jgi:hypothetical protein
MSTTTKAAHTPGAIRAAKAIFEDVVDQLKQQDIVIKRGPNEGIWAEIIDRETAAPEMLEALKEILPLARMYYIDKPLEAAKTKVEAAIQKAKGGQ